MTYADLMKKRNQFVLTCSELGLCSSDQKLQECNDFFTKKATELGWIEKVDTKVQ